MTLRCLLVGAVGLLGLLGPLSPGVAQESAAPAPQPGVALAVNAAGPALPDEGYAADAYFANGRLCYLHANRGNRNLPGFEGTIYETLRCDRGTLNIAIPTGREIYDLELHFIDNWHGEAGRRLMDIFVEDQLVLDDLDILGETGGDIRAPLVRLIEGVDPALSGDPSTIEIGIRTVRDTALINGFRVLCPDRAEDCSGRWQRALAARWHGIWERAYRYEVERAGGGERVPLRMVRSRLRSSEAGVHVALDIGWLACEIVFSTGIEPEAMIHRGDTCAGGAPLADWALSTGEDGTLRLSFTSGGLPVSLDLHPVSPAAPKPSVVPDERALDLVGVNLAATVAEVKQAVLQRFEPRDTAAPWHKIQSDESFILHVFESAEGIARPVERYTIFAADDGPEAVPFALLRLWRPEPVDQPAVATLLAALRDKYGQPSTDAVEMVDGLSARRVGFLWSYDRAGVQMQGDACGGSLLAELPVPGDAGLPERRLIAQDRCGYELEAVLASATGSEPVPALQLLLTDDARLVRRRYEAGIAGVLEDIDRVLDLYGAAQAAREARDAIQPRL